MMRAFTLKFTSSKLRLLVSQIEGSAFIPELSLYVGEGPLITSLNISTVLHSEPEFFLGIAL